MNNPGQSRCGVRDCSSHDLARGCLIGRMITAKGTCYQLSSSTPMYLENVESYISKVTAGPDRMWMLVSMQVKRGVEDRSGFHGIVDSIELGMLNILTTIRSCHSFSEIACMHKQVLMGV